MQLRRPLLRIAVRSSLMAASLLADPTDASKTVYGQHPNDEGGTVLATALVEKIREMKNK
ncbi:hypothetical protein [Ruminococcus sp.]|uniref:hypothetical protein n=1 Tax=Ruminococcus sp. TaxID=41978 RepID=UPI003FEF8EB7